MSPLLLDPPAARTRGSLTDLQRTVVESHTAPYDETLLVPARPRTYLLPARSGARLSVSIEGEEPAWLLSTLERLGELLQLPPAWNSYAARPVDLSAAAAAIKLLSEIMRSDTPAPSVIPTFPGGVQLEWHMRSIDLEVEITPELQILASYEDDETGAAWDRDCTADISLLQRELATLTERS